MIITDAERLLPVTQINVVEADLDFRKPSLINGRFIDHAFKIDPKGERAISLEDPLGIGVEMTFDEEAKWIQIHAADRTGGADSRKCLAVEPMTCPPNAFNSGLDLIHLHPGEKHVFRWGIRAIS